jgi:peptidoglycan hydrolase-like protein with peptidoglycan-binding domain
MSLLSVAQSQIGVRESPSGSNRQKYGVWYGWNGVAWCDIFVSWCAAQAGLGSIIGKSAYCPSHVAYFKRKGMWRDANYRPVPGDIVFFASGGEACHVGIVEARNGSYSVTTIEGNTSVTSNDNGGRVMRRVRTYGNPYKKGGWGILGFAHYQGGAGKATATKTATSSRNWLQKGDKGQAVKELQTMLMKAGYSCGKYGADGEFGADTEKAVRAYQINHGLVVDGQAGVKTVASLEAYLKTKKPTSTTKKNAWIEALQRELRRQGYDPGVIDGESGPKTLAACPQLGRKSKGGLTYLMQNRLNALGYSCGAADGANGPKTQAAIKAFQRAKGLSADGIVGKNTWRKLLGL